MIIHDWKFEKIKNGLFKKTKWKKNWKKNGLEQKQKKKNGEKKRKVEVQFELYCVKLVELMIFEKKKIVLH